MKNNYGFFIIFFIFILYLICINIFYCKSLKILIGEIIKIISAINSKEYNTTKNRLSYSLFNKIHRKINIQQTKSPNNSSFIPFTHRITLSYFTTSVISIFSIAFIKFSISFFQKSAFSF